MIINFLYTGKLNWKYFFEIVIAFQTGTFFWIYTIVSVNIPENTIFKISKHKWKPSLLSKKKFLECLQFLQKLGFLLKHVGKFREVQKSMLTGSGRSGKFRIYCSQKREDRGSLEAISCHFSRRYLSSASSNFLGNGDPVMLWDYLIEIGSYLGEIRKYCGGGASHRRSRGSYFRRRNSVLSPAKFGWNIWWVWGRSELTPHSWVQPADMPSMLVPSYG